MKDLTSILSARGKWCNPNNRERRIKDYLRLANQLSLKRNGSFLIAAILSSFYYDPISIFATYAAVVLTELLDVLLVRRFRNWDVQDKVTGRVILKRMMINTTLSAVAIGVFVVNIALLQTSTGHFTPTFFLFAASVFAAMYNSQLAVILLLRLSIYAVAFLVIAFIDVLRVHPPLTSEVWLEFFTIMFVVYFIVDIAAKFYLNYQKNLEQMKLIRLENERTKAALEIKSQFLATVSHELRTPLTSIIGSLELIKNNAFGPLPPAVKPALNIAARNGKRLADLIEDLLDLQKFESGTMMFQLAPISATDLLKEAVESSAGFASKHRIDVTVEDEDRNCLIMGDRDRLVQVLNNLFSNAIKFSPQGGTVTAGVTATKKHVRIFVRDTGPGIPEGARDRVFGKFSQIDSSDVRKVGGTGLGLYISQQIAQHHEAKIDYESELGHRATFFIEFARLSDAEDQDYQHMSLSEVA